jgi:hypothetical protein
MPESVLGKSWVVNRAAALTAEGQTKSSPQTDLLSRAVRSPHKVTVSRPRNLPNATDSEDPGYGADGRAANVAIAASVRRGGT